MAVSMQLITEGNRIIAPSSGGMTSRWRGLKWKSSKTYMSTEVWEQIKTNALFVFNRTINLINCAINRD